MSKILTLARFTCIEGIRNRLGVLTVGIVVVSMALALFLRQLAITESAQIQVAVLAAIFRLVGVFFVSAFVILSQLREYSDKGLDLLLSTALTRAQYVLGKLVGFWVLGVVVAVLFTLPLFSLAPAKTVLSWGVSLCLEISLVTALSLFCAITFSQFLVAFAAVIGVYALSRIMSSLLLMGGAQVARGESWASEISDTMLRGISLVLPRLDRFTQTSWLVYPGEADPALLLLIVQFLLFTCLIVAATMFDFYRKSI